MGNLAGKTVLVTGGGGGIGRAIALAFAAEGSRVAVTGRSRPPLDAVVDEIRALGAEALAWPCDVGQKRQVENLKYEINRRLGTVQILVNNAGIAPAASFLEMEDDLWEEVLRVNLTGTYNCCKVFLPDMVAAGSGRIINIGSTVSKIAYSHVSAYTTSKHAVLGLTRALAVETARSGVTVNSVCPGYVAGELTLRNACLLAEKTGKPVDTALHAFKKASPQNRLIDAEEVAYAVVMLASASARGITGQAVNVDGGTVMV